MNRTVCRLLVVGMMAALLSIVSQPPQALAALAAPSNLSPSGVSQSGSPVLQWSRVGKAVKYEVQLATDPGFATLKYSATTTNHRATPTMTLPQQELFWRVRSINASNVKSNWAETSYTASEVSGPSLVAPADDPSGTEPLQQPDEPALLTWTPVSNAASYTIEIDDSDDFVGAKTYTSKTTSFLFQAADPTVPLNSWRVRAVFSGSYNSTWSDVGHFTIGALVAPTLTAPVDSPTTQVTDAMLDWEPVPGAVKYEVQVDTNDQFVDPLADKATVFSTRYAKPATLDNDQYWWRVRAIDVNGKASPWASSLNQFQRSWNDAPDLVYPNNSTLVGNPFYFQWDPVPHASSYQLEVSEDVNFSSKETCTTFNTTYTPGSQGNGCTPTPGNVTYWRVRGLDNPTGVLGLYSQARQFTYSPATVTQLSPSSGSTVSVPTLHWAAYPQAIKYVVTVRKASGAAVLTKTTYADSYTPTSRVRLDPSDGPFRWTVQAVRQDTEKTQVPTFARQPDVSGDRGCRRHPGPCLATAVTSQRHRVDTLPQSHLGARLRHRRRAGGVLHGLDQQAGQHLGRRPGRRLSVLRSDRPLGRLDQSPGVYNWSVSAIFIDWKHLPNRGDAFVRDHQCRQGYPVSGVCRDWCRLRQRGDDLREGAQQRPVKPSESLREPATDTRVQVEPG